jgi:hypothetical protein
VLEALRSGWQLGISFNPLTSLVGAVVAAVLLARRPGPLRWALGLAVLGGSWLLGDGLAILAHARELLAAGAEPDPAQWLALALWVVLGFGFGYVLPAWAGTFVGRRVTWGTGWIAAGVVAASVSGLVTAAATAR